MIHAQPSYGALHAARQRQALPDVTEPCAVRAGIEGTLSQGMRAGDLRRARSVGLSKTRLPGTCSPQWPCMCSASEPGSRTLPVLPTRRSLFAALPTEPLPPISPAALLPLLDGTPRKMAYWD